MTIIGKIKAKSSTIEPKTIMDEDKARFLTFSSSLLTNGFNAAASTNDANNSINNPINLGINNKINIVKIIKIMVFGLKNFFNMINFPNQKCKFNTVIVTLKNFIVIHHRSIYLK